LDITTAVLGSWQAKGFTAQEGNGLGFHFPDIPWRPLGVREVAFVRVAKHDVANFVEKCLCRESGNRADRDLPAMLGVALGVAVEVLEGNTLDFQSGKGSFFVPFRDVGGLVFRAFGLCKNEPMGLVGEMGKGKLLLLVGAVVLLYRLNALASQRHAQGQCLLTLPHVSAKLFPLRESGQRPRLDSAQKALEQSQELISE